MYIFNLFVDTWLCQVFIAAHRVFLVASWATLAAVHSFLTAAAFPASERGLWGSRLQGLVTACGPRVAAPGH